MKKKKKYKYEALKNIYLIKFHFYNNISRVESVRSSMDTLTFL